MGCPHWIGEPGELIVEMPWAKRIRGDQVATYDIYD